MVLQAALLDRLATLPAADAWRAILDHAWTTCSPALPSASPERDVDRRDLELAALDDFIATAGWDLFSVFEESVERTADALAGWWTSRSPGRAVLILDALSLREVPWVIEGARARGYEVHAARATCSELPGETTHFAKALGFAQRSALENDGSAKTHRLPGARTEATGMPWEDCARSIGAEPDWVFWHHWPDEKLHDLASPGRGLRALSADARAQLTSDAFWSFVERLATGRRLVITSDHGYAATGQFPDAPEDQTAYLRELFRSGRVAPDGGPPARWVPPLDLAVTSRHGRRRLVLGRRKWKSPGGYPLLAHGGLSVLEVASPFIELSRRP